jgi:hypothetical protein
MLDAPSAAGVEREKEWELATSCGEGTFAATEHNETVSSQIESDELFDSQTG